MSALVDKEVVEHDALELVENAGLVLVESAQALILRLKIRGFEVRLSLDISQVMDHHVDLPIFLIFLPFSQLNHVNQIPVTHAL